MIVTTGFRISNCYVCKYTRETEDKKKPGEARRNNKYNNVTYMSFFAQFIGEYRNRHR
jgi:hypothetical protein